MPKVGAPQSASTSSSDVAVGVALGHAPWRPPPPFGRPPIVVEANRPGSAHSWAGTFVAMAHDVAKGSIFHEAPPEVLRLAPRLVLELLAAAHQPFDTGDPLTDGDAVEVEITDSQLSEPQPHLRAVDFVVIVRSKTRSRCVCRHRSATEARCGEEA